MSVDVSNAMPTLNLGGGSTPQLQKLPSTQPAAKPFAEPPAPLNLRKPLNLSPRPLDLKPAPLTTQRYGAGASPATTLPTSQGTSNALNRSLQRHQQTFSNGGSHTAPVPKGTRGLNQSAANINAFGSTKGNVASNAGTATTGSARTNAAIEAWNKAKASGTNAAPKGTAPINPTMAKSAASAGAITTSAGFGSSILFTPVSANPAGVVVGLGAGALAAGLWAGNKLYEGLGSPFGPSLGVLLKDALNSPTGADIDPINGEYVAPEAPPFEGGQSPGVRYHFELTMQYGDVFTPDSRTHSAVGPLSVETGTQPDKLCSASLKHGRGTYYSTFASNPDNCPVNYHLRNVRRADGQADTGGNPPVPAPIFQNPAKWLPSSELPTFAPPAITPKIEPTTSEPLLAPQPEPEAPAVPAVPYVPTRDELPNPEPLAPTESPGDGRRPQEPPLDAPLPPLFIPAREAAKSQGATKGTTPANPSKGRLAVPPAAKKSTKCPCTGGINAHTDQLGQQINTRLDALADNANDTVQNGLLAAILGFVEQIAEVTGVGAFPVSAPANLNQKASGTTTLNNLAEAHLWQANNLDSTVGGWPNTIENLDSGGTIENLTVSDSLAEIQGLLMAMAIGQGINQQGIFKTLTETTGIKQQSMLARQYAQSNAEYLGYNLRQTSRQVPNTYTPGVENILELLNPGKIPMEAVENADDMDLQSCLRELCASAAIIRAVFFRNTGTGDIEQAIRNQINQARGVNESSASSFSDYLERVEQGFGTQQPYGREQTQGPHITDLSQNPTQP
ncbi:MAG: hypothetical protein AAF572_11690 [Cyanobacteria bacterium P01_B01_bin.77]